MALNFSGKRLGMWRSPRESLGIQTLQKLMPWLGCKKRLATIQVSSPARTIRPEDGQQWNNDSIWCWIAYERY